jgi:sulfur oxidation c-type cytochrome SoxX
MWPAPLLTGAAVQANCIRCHDTNAEPIAGAPELNKGRQFYVEKVCWSCHTIEGVSDGKIGPDLSDAGARFSMDYLRESIVHPEANIASSKMPKFDWVDDDSIVTPLTIYLKSQRRTRLKEYALAPVGTEVPTVTYVEPETATAEVGRKVFHGIQDSSQLRHGGCINCHTIRESDGQLKGGHVGPELTYVGRARSEAYIREHIRNSRDHAPDSVMPIFYDLTDAEVDSLLLYLKSLDYVDSGATEGARVYTTYCASCHGLDMKGRGDNYRLLDPYPRNLARPQFVESYKDRFPGSIAKGVEGTAMPPWEKVLSQEQIRAVTDFIVQRSRMENPDRKFVRIDAPLPKSGDTDRLTEKEIVEVDVTRGETAYLAHCTGCHGKLANGKGPNAYTLGNVYPRNLLNDQFMERDDLTDDRLYRSIILGVPGTPMPSHSHLSDQAILDLIAYIRTLTK